MEVNSSCLVVIALYMIVFDLNVKMFLLFVVVGTTRDSCCFCITGCYAATEFLCFGTGLVQ